MTDSSLRLPVALIIMDGFGLTSSSSYNAVTQAHTPVLSRIVEDHPCITLQASGEAVGLPPHQMGNSEVGHLNIGAGRIIYQELSRINKACQSGELLQNEVLCHAMDEAVRKRSTLHLAGLTSDGGVHASIEHAIALLRMAKERGVTHILLHLFLDGRDVAPQSAVPFVERMMKEAQDLSSGATTIEIASLSGRYYAMDRDNRWERVERAWSALAEAHPYVCETPIEYINKSYDQGITDEFVEPVSFVQTHMTDDDIFIFWNFRPDRARQLTRVLCDASQQCFDEKDPACMPHPQVVCLTEYDPTLPADVAFPKVFPEMVLADVLSQAHLRQLHIAETEKYAHVTFFLNGGIEEKKPGETRILIPSPKVATYDIKPEMSAQEVTKALVDAIDQDQADVYIVNFANCDMVGHTGSIEAATAAVEAVDTSVGVVLEALKNKGGVALITADHGNAECMLAEGGIPHTAHTTNLVPLCLVDYSGSDLAFSSEVLSQAELSTKVGLAYPYTTPPEVPYPALCDIAPTLLTIIGIEPPSEMTGTSLIAS